MTRLLVLRLSALGDVIHTIPAVVSLRDAAQIAWVVEAPYRELVELVAGVETIPVRMKKEPRTALAAIRRMRGYDVSIDFQGLIKSALLPWAARVKERVGFKEPRERVSRLFTNRRVRVDTTKHVIEQNLELGRGALASRRLNGRRLVAPGGRGGGDAADSAGADVGAPLWNAYPTPVDAHGEIILLPGAGKANKLWPVERFRDLAKRLGDRALVVWGPGERERAEAIGARLAPPTNLRELAFLLQQAKVVIGGDTGPLHLAAALGTNVVGLYGPTDPRRNGPYGQLDHCVNAYVTTKSMDSIRVEEVMKILEGLGAA